VSYVNAVVLNLFRPAAPYKREIQFAAPRGEPIAIWFDVLRHFENVFSMQSWKRASFWNPNPARARYHKPEPGPSPTFIFWSPI